MEPLSAAFPLQLDYLRRYFTIVDPLQWIENPQPPRRALAISFDDGYMDFFTHAFPHLEKRNLPALVFLVPGAMDEHSPLWFDRLYYLISRITTPTLELDIAQHRIILSSESQKSRTEGLQMLRMLAKKMTQEERAELLQKLETASGIDGMRAFDEYPLLSWEQTKTMSARGIRFGSHSLTHPVLSRLSEQQLHHELQESKRRISEVTGQAVDCLAYPNGSRDDYNDAVIRMARRTGYRFGMTFIDGVYKPGMDEFSIPRCGVFNARLPSFAVSMFRKTH